MVRKIIFFFILIAVSCSRKQKETNLSYVSLLPDWVTERIFLDDSNAYSSAKAALGRYLFYDTRLSFNQTKSCGSCHAQEFSFTDNYRRSAGAMGDLTAHNAPALINLVLNPYLTYTDSSLHFPEQQIHNPMFHTRPVELGWEGHEDEIVSRIRSHPFYYEKFKDAFPDHHPAITTRTIQLALATFVKTIVSFKAPFDSYLSSNDSFTLPPDVRRGYRLFVSDSLKCIRCHGGINFNLPPDGAPPYFNTGFFPDTSVHRGLMQTTGKSADAGKYRVPTLRNLAYTAPYLHDGSVEHLEEVIIRYENGGVRFDQLKHPFITGFRLNSQQRLDLIRFLFSLSDSTLRTQPKYRNPFGQL